MVRESERRGARPRRVGALRAGAASITGSAVARLVVVLAVTLLLGLGCAEPFKSSAANGTGGPQTTSGVTAAPTIDPSPTTGSEPTTGSSSTAPPPSDSTVSDHRTIGTSVEGRAIELSEFGSGSQRVLVVGGLHGDESGGRVARQLVEYLTEHPGSVPVGLRMQVIPSANPDGEAAGLRANANGVDLNRNFPTSNWSGTLDPGDVPTAGLSGGAAPGSEPETQALLAVLAEGIDLVISLHSAGGIIDYDGPGGLAIAERMSAVCGLPVSEVGYQAHVTGSLGTYVPETYGAPVITIELKGTGLTSGIRKALLSAVAADGETDASE